ncbi:MAG TPA: tetratricopeptide repeat protein [Terracidiphilus sp.]|nr:tetratricopeptide repeat protein [Terracidiphilus sp.]
MPALIALSPGFLPSQETTAISDAEVQRDFQVAMAAQDRGDLDGAEALLMRLHTAHPGIFAIDESLGLLLASRGDKYGALRLLEAGAREEPSSDVAHANLGAAFYQLNQSQSAIVEFQRAVQINPNNVSSQESLGRLWMDDRRPDKAADALLAAVRLKPDDQDMMLDCVTTLLQANRLDEAQKMLSSFGNADRSARAQSLLGELNERKGSFQSAAESYARAAELDPSEQNAWQLGFEYLRHWTFNAAAAEFQVASGKFPESERLRLGLGVALYGEAQYVRAIPVFANLLNDEPGDALYAELLGMSCDAPLPARVPQCATLVEYAGAHPADAKAATYAASWLLKYEDTAEHLVLARNLIEHVLAANPNLPEAQFQMGRILQYGKDWAGSIPFLERAVKLKPDYAEAHYHLALAYWRTGRKRDGDAQMELQKKFARQEQEDLDQHLRQITTFTIGAHP